MTTEPLRGSVDVVWPAAYLLDLPQAPPPPSGYPLLVLLHGAEDDAAKLRDRMEGLEHAPYARLYPDGPFPVDVTEGEGRRIGRTWYQYTGDQEAFRVALRFGIDHLLRVVHHVALAHPIDRARAVLLGYSQGGYLAGVAAFFERRHWRGLVAIATRIQAEILEPYFPGAQGFPVLVLHGERDASIAVERQRASCAALAEAGVHVRFETHPGGHGLRRSLVPRIDDFVRAVVGS